MSNSTPVWHDIFRKVTLKPDNLTLEADKFDDTLNIVRGPGVSWGSDSTTDTFSILVDYNLQIPAATTKIALEDINGNLSEIELTAGRGVAINRISAQELQIESFSVTETDTLHTVTTRNNITTNTVFVNNLQVGTIASDTSEDGFLSFDAGHNLIGDGVLGNPLRFSPLYQDSAAANNTDQFEFTAAGPGTLAYAANYVADAALATGSVTLEREDPANPGNWTVLDTQSGTAAGFAYFIDGTYSELYSGTVTYRLTYSWTGNTGTVTWYTYDTFEAGAYTPIDNPLIKTDSDNKTVDINDIQFFQNTVRTLTSNTDVVFDLSGTGQVRVLGNITADNFYGDVFGDVTGNLTGNVTGDVSGNAGTVTDGVYTTGSYANPSWITSLDGSKIINGVLTTGSYYDPSWITGLDASKIIGSINLSDITIDGNIRLFDNVIETTVSNSDLELRASGTGQIRIFDSLSVQGNVTLSGNFVNGTQLRTGTTSSDTLSISAYDVDGTTYTNLITLTAANDPQLAITSTATGTINNMSIGTTTRAAGNFTTLDANGNVTLGSDSADIITVNGTLANSTIFRAGTTASDSFSLAGYDTNTGPQWRNLITITSGIAPTVTIDSNGTGTIDNMTIGATTPAAATFTSLTTTGVTTLQEITEVITPLTGATGVVVHDYNGGTVWFHSSMAANFTANFTNIPTTNDRTIVVTLLLNQGVAGYFPNAVQINGVGQTLRWANNVTPTPSTNKIDVAVFSLIRTGSTWYVLGNYTTYN